jgi:hypothetical protein
MNVLGAVVAVAVGSAAMANPTTMGIDINSLSATYVGPGPFGVNSSGAINLTVDTNSVLAGVDLDGVGQSLSAGLLSFTGQILLNSGFVQGGSLSVVNSDGTSYTAQIVAGVGQVRVQAGQGFSIDGLTFQGLFNGPSFAGVAIPQFFAAQPLTGAFLTFKFRPDENGFDPDSDIDMFIEIPLPTGAGLASMGMLALGGLRRRR